MTAAGPAPPVGILSRHRWTIGLAATIAAGIAFRLIWGSDLEYAGDQAWMVDYVRRFQETGAYSLVGMISSAGPGLPHPGLGPWLFLAIGAVVPHAGPVELARAVAIVNIAAILLMAAMAARMVAPAEREPWLWAVALLSGNPLAVEYSRKLWAMDTFPLFTLVMLWGWWHRGRRRGAFVWGLVAALLGQVHLTGFVFAAAFFGFVLLFDRRSVHWVAWLAGTLAGLVPALPWVLAVARGGGAVHAARFYNPLVPFGHWVNFALGIDLFKTLGDDFGHFLTTPTIGGQATYLAGALFVVIVIVFAALLKRAIDQLHENRARVLRLIGMRTPTGLALNSAFLGYCALLAAMSEPTYLHYMIIALPLLALWIAWIGHVGTGETARSRAATRRLLALVVVAQAGLAASFLLYIHQTQTIHGDFGTAYGSQHHPGFRP